LSKHFVWVPLWGLVSYEGMQCVCTVPSETEVALRWLVFKVLLQATHTYASNSQTDVQINSRTHTQEHLISLSPFL